MSLHYEKIQTKIGFGKQKEDKYVGKRRLADPFDLKRLAKEISHITGQPQATAEIVLTYMVQAIEDAIKDGRAVDLGIGTLSPAINTKAADDAKDVKVVRKRVLFRPSKELRTIVQNMSVRLVTDDDDEDDETSQDPGDNPGGNSNNGSGGSGGFDTGD